MALVVTLWGYIGKKGIQVDWEINKDVSKPVSEHFNLPNHSKHMAVYDLFPAAKH